MAIKLTARYDFQTYAIAMRVAYYLDGILRPQEFVHDRYGPIIGQRQYFLGARAKFAINSEIRGIQYQIRKINEPLALDFVLDKSFDDILNDEPSWKINSWRKETNHRFFVINLRTTPKF